MAEFEPHIVGFFCNWCSYTGADPSGTSQTECLPNVRAIHVMCSGRIDEKLILKAFIAGADGVLICGCHPGECHYQQGNLNARRKVTGLSPFLDSVGIGKDRLRLEWVSESENPKMADIIQSFTDRIKQLGPSPFKKRHDQHCLSTT